MAVVMSSGSSGKADEITVIVYSKIRRPRSHLNNRKGLRRRIPNERKGPLLPGSESCSLYGIRWPHRLRLEYTMSRFHRYRQLPAVLRNERSDRANDKSAVKGSRSERSVGQRHCAGSYEYGNVSQREER